MSERARRILEAIENAELSYGKLSKITGIPKSAIQRYATGETEKIPIDRIEKIAKATSVTAEYLMCWDKEPSYTKGEDAVNLIKKYNLLSDANKQAVLILIDNLIAGQN